MCPLLRHTGLRKLDYETKTIWKAFDLKCLWRLLEDIMIQRAQDKFEYVLQTITGMADSYQPVLQTRQKRNPVVVWPVSRHEVQHLQGLGTVKGEGRRGRPRQMWLDSNKDWTQWKGREDEEGLERCCWTATKTGHSGREEKTRKA